MKTRFINLFIMLLAFGSISAQTEGPIPGQYIVLLKENAATPVALQEVAYEDRETAYQQNNTKRLQNLMLLANLRNAAGVAPANVLADYADVIVGFSALLSPQQVAQLSGNPLVEGVYQDYYISGNPAQDQGIPEEFSPEGQTTPCAINNAGGSTDGTGKKTWIWILDTGIDTDHPDLNVHAVTPYAKSFIPGQSVEDGNGHGTHVAGIAAAKNNSIGIVGVSAGAKVVPVKVLPNSGVGGSMSYIIQGLNHVASYDKTNDVVNMSIGAFPIGNCENSNLPLKNAIVNLGNSGTWVCMASGNNANNAAQCSPGCINSGKVYTVGAMTCGKGCYTGPNWSTAVVDWVATGQNVYSTYKNGGYATLTGTSQATPVVAGIIHARSAAPVGTATVTCGNSVIPPAAYKIAKRI
ncbi:MAG: S8 family serine peptidase [Chitinophagales bacterium]|nr:S8 family serine peptidase [Chitinophagales bacterium]